MTYCETDEVDFQVLRLRDLGEVYELQFDSQGKPQARLHRLGLEISGCFWQQGISWELARVSQWALNPEEIL